jgi:hypothetical protein
VGTVRHEGAIDGSTSPVWVRRGLRQVRSRTALLAAFLGVLLLVPLVVGAQSASAVSFQHPPVSPFHGHRPHETPRLHEVHTGSRSAPSAAAPPAAVPPAAVPSAAAPPAAVPSVLPSFFGIPLPSAPLGLAVTPPSKATGPPVLVPSSLGVPPRGEATAYGCAAALAYLEAYAAPDFILQCPGYAQGHEATTMCISGLKLCNLGRFIVIADPCAAAYMNEASNSWVLLQLSDAVIDPYGQCR